MTSRHEPVTWAVVERRMSGLVAEINHTRSEKEAEFLIQHADAVFAHLLDRMPPSLRWASTKAG